MSFVDQVGHEPLVGGGEPGEVYLLQEGEVASVILLLKPCAVSTP
jgi:hypothetical protein